EGVLDKDSIGGVGGDAPGQPAQLFNSGWLLSVTERHRARPTLLAHGAPTRGTPDGPYPWPEAGPDRPIELSAPARGSFRTVSRLPRRLAARFPVPSNRGQRRCQLRSAGPTRPG